MHFDADRSHLLAIVSVNLLFFSDSSAQKSSDFLFIAPSLYELVGFQNGTGRNFVCDQRNQGRIICFVSFQLAVLLHGSNESIDWAEIASDRDIDCCPRMG